MAKEEAFTLKYEQIRMDRLNSIASDCRRYYGLPPVGWIKNKTPDQTIPSICNQNTYENYKSGIKRYCTKNRFTIDNMKGRVKTSNGMARKNASDHYISPLACQPWQLIKRMEKSGKI